MKPSEGYNNWPILADVRDDRSELVRENQQLQVQTISNLRWHGYHAGSRDVDSLNVTSILGAVLGHQPRATLLRWLIAAQEATAVEQLLPRQFLDPTNLAPETATVESA